MVMAAMVFGETTGLFAPKRALAFLSEVECLHGDLTVRSDQEPAITSLVNEIGLLRGAAGGGKFIVEASPVRSSQSNGRVERAIQSVNLDVRTMVSPIFVTNTLMKVQHVAVSENIVHNSCVPCTVIWTWRFVLSRQR